MKKTIQGSGRRLVNSLAMAMLVGTLAAPASAAVGKDTDVMAVRVTAPNGATSLLVASVHVPLDGLRQPDAMALLQKAKVLLVENSPTIGPQPAHRGAYMSLSNEALRRPNGFAPWADDLTDAQIALLRHNFICLATTMGYESRTTQWVDLTLAMNSAYLASMIAYAPCATTAVTSRDQLFMDAARVKGIPVDILETNADAEIKRQAVPWQVFKDQLYYAFTPNGKQVLPKIVAAMNSGDFDAVYRLSASGIRHPQDVAAFTGAMLRDRNRAWMPQLHKYLNAGDGVVLVGAAHLAGADGLLALLRQAGFSVRPVRLPAAP